MGIEREHKYLVKDLTYKNMATSAISIEQGYLCRDKERTVRIRVAADKGYITVKGVTRGDTRAEFEYSIPVDDARAMLDLCEGSIISKTRWIVPYEGFIWEVDEFHSTANHLTLAEIELPEDVHEYPLPPFVGENVTGNPNYYNSNLK